MENFDQIFTLIATEEGIRLNLDILETGILNIIGLIILVVNFCIDFIGSILKERHEKITQSLKDAEDRLTEANIRLTEAKKQLNQADVVITEIKIETLATKRRMLKVDILDAKLDLKLRFERALNAFKSKERQIFFEIKERITSLVLNRTVTRVKETFMQTEPSIQLINNTIRTLELPS